MKIESASVLGLGNWGTALANHLANQGISVTGWTVDPEVVASVSERHTNCRYLTHVELSPNLHATGSLEKALVNDFIVLAFPSSALAEMVPKVRAKKRSIIISAIKGLEVDSLLTPLGYCAQHLPAPAQLVVLSGPSFARDVVIGKPAGVVAASKDDQAAQLVGEVFGQGSLRVYLSRDPLGVELGGIFKNVIALAAGVIDGMELGDSARAGLITRGLAEITRLACAMGAKRETFSGLSGLGDLIMTATCDQSRNRTVGLRLGRGEALQIIIDNLGSVAEGVKATPLVLSLAEKHGVEMPISAQVLKLLNGELSARQMVDRLMARPMKHEFEELG